MPITGTFEADFSQFSTATKAANEELKTFQSTSTDTARTLTDLEKATTTAAPHVSTLSESYSKFDGALNAVGIHIGPQIKAIEDIGGAAGKSASEIGLLGSAGLVVGAAMAGWNFGRWIAEITGADAAIASLTARVMGWGDLAKETSGAVQDSIDLAFQRTGIHARDGAEALALNTKWAKENQAAAKENAAEVKAAADAHDKWEAAVQAVTAAGKGYAAILADIDPRTVELAKHALENKASQTDVATAYKLTETQVRAVAQALEAARQAAADAAAEERKYNAELMTSYNNQLKMTADVEKARAAHYGLDSQIEMLQQLIKTNDELARATIAELSSEQDKMKVEEANARRRGEIEIEIGKLREQQTAIVGASTLRAVENQTALNKAYGLDAKGAILLPQDAMTEYAKKLDTINRTLPEGIEKTSALALANKQLEESFLADAKAADVSTKAIAGASTAAATAAQTAAARANASFGGGTIDASQITAGNTDPAILGYLAQGYTLGEAIAIAMGQGAHIIGQSPTMLAKLAGRRAAGGPVSSGSPYLVGERGPEVFIPGASGAIAPSLSRGGGISIVINGSVLSTRAELAALVGDAFVAAYRQGGNRLPA